MKKIFIILVSLSTLLSCSGDDDRGGAISINETPGIPDLVFPTNGLTCTNFNLEFDWNSVTDPNGDTVSYVIDLAADDSFTNIVFTAVTTEIFRTFTLEKGVTYYWRVKARDSQGSESAYSVTQSFFTEPDAGVNTLPTAASIENPSLGEELSQSSTTLSWTASDVDEDVLSYDVYFGDTNPPSLVAENLETTTFEVTLSANTTYYWQVVVKDANEGAVIGQVWDFRTE